MWLCLRPEGEYLCVYLASPWVSSNFRCHGAVANLKFSGAQEGLEGFVELGKGP